MALTNKFSTYKILYYSAPHVQWHAIVMLYEGRSLVASEPRDTAERYVRELHAHGLNATMRRST